VRNGQMRNDTRVHASIRRKFRKLCDDGSSEVDKRRSNCGCEVGRSIAPTRASASGITITSAD
jgi:hypothetical protein